MSKNRSEPVRANHQKKILVGVIYWIRLDRTIELYTKSSLDFFVYVEVFLFFIKKKEKSSLSIRTSVQHRSPLILDLNVNLGHRKCEFLLLGS